MVHRTGYHFFCWVMWQPVLCTVRSSYVGWAWLMHTKFEWPAIHHAITHNQHNITKSKKEKLFIYLALAKPTLPGQFVLFASSQSKANASKYFCLFQCAAWNKSSDFWAAWKNYYSWAARIFNICFFHCLKLADSGLQKLNYRAAWNAWFSEGVVRFLSFLCQSSPSFDPKMDIPEQHKIKHYSRAAQNQILESVFIIIIIYVRKQHEILKPVFPCSRVWPPLRWQQRHWRQQQWWGQKLTTIN